MKEKESANMALAQAIVAATINTEEGKKCDKGAFALCVGTLVANAKDRVAEINAITDETEKNKQTQDFFKSIGLE